MTKKLENKEMLDSFRAGIDTKLVDKHGRNMEAVYAGISGFKVDWSIKGCGFGQHFFSYDEDLERVVIDGDHMSPKMIELVMKQILKTAVYTDFEEVNTVDTEITMAEALELATADENVMKSFFEVYCLSYESGESGLAYQTVRINESPLEDEEERWKFVKFFFPENILEIAIEDKKMSFIEGVKKYAVDVKSYYKTVTVKSD